MVATYSPVGLKSSPLITDSKNIVNSMNQLRLMITVLGMPFGLAGKLDNIFGLGDIRINIK